MATNKMLEDLKAFLETEEGKASLERTQRKWLKEDAFRERWNEKITKFIASITDEDELENLYVSFDIHDDKRREILWKQGIDGESSLCFYVLNAIQTLGTECPDEMFGMFTSDMREYKGYIVELICGQGCFTKIYRK